MKLLKRRVWSIIDIGLLKWSCILSGMVLGAFLADFTKRHVLLFLIAIILLALKPTISYLLDDGE